MIFHEGNEKIILENIGGATISPIPGAFPPHLEYFPSSQNTSKKNHFVFSECKLAKKHEFRSRLD